MKKQFIVTIEVDEKNIANKYPNYSINFRSPEEFIDRLMNDFTLHLAVTNPIDDLEQWGFSKHYEKKEEK